MEQVKQLQDVYSGVMTGCPKCGASHLKVRWHESRYDRNSGFHVFGPCRLREIVTKGDREHLDVKCETCLYEWTKEVLE